ncbi:MAG: YybH family protein [Terriglobales bacterium]
MKTTASCLILVLLAIPALAQRSRQRPPAEASRLQQQQQAEAEDRQAIDQLHQDEIDASISFDVDKLAALWDDEIVSLPPHSKPLQGPAANRAYLEAERKALANVDILGYNQEWNEVRMLGDYAYEWGVIHERQRAVNAQQETAIEYNIMRVLKRQPSGSWRIYRQIWNDQRPEAKPAEKPKPEEKPHVELKP